MQVALLQQPNSQTELEVLVVVWACEHLHLYIYGKTVTVYTDHKPLASIYGNPSSKPPARIEKWVYDFIRTAWQSSIEEENLIPQTT